jgi:TRAP-type uncharacterized transport system substrate-binding protein
MPRVHRWRRVGLVAGVIAVGLVAVGALLRFLAPDLSYRITDRAAESLSGRGNRKFRIALGAATGSYYHVGTVLNRYLKEKSGYELELVATAGVPENVGALLDPDRQIDLATIESSSDEAARAEGIVGLAAVGRQYFFVIVPNDSPVHDIRDLSGTVDPGVRSAGQAPTLGERVLEFYDLLPTPSPSVAASPAVTIVRPEGGGNVANFEAGRMQAVTRTQFLSSGLIGNILRNGNYRIVPIRDHEAVAAAIPGTEQGFIPAGAYGPGRRVPPEPVPTLSVASLLIARADLPGRVATDILEAVYDPRFARDIRHQIAEDSGRHVGGLALHPAASIFYHRNDLLTSDRLGRLSFVASVIAGGAAAAQFLLRSRDRDRRRRRRRLLESELAKVEAIRHALQAGPDEAHARALMTEADELLCEAERDAAANLLDADGVQALRSVHGICGRLLQQRTSHSASMPSARLHQMP